MTAVVPHPPIIISAVGREAVAKVDNTIKSLKKVSRQIADFKPDTVVVISPHGPVFRDAIAVFDGNMIRGDLSSFNASQEEVEVSIDSDYIALLERESRKQGINLVRLDQDTAYLYNIERKLDHGALVPMLFLKEEGIKAKYVNITYGLYPFADLYAFGAAIRNVGKNTGRKIVVIASGDLSHCLSPDAPGGFSPEGEIFDKEILGILKEGKSERLFKLDETLIEKAGECGLRSIVTALGALDGQAFTPEVLSYEGPFGVGYLVGTFIPKEESAPSLLNKLQEKEKQRVSNEREKESFPVAVARNTVEGHVREGKAPDPSQDILEEFSGAAGVFVSLKKKGQLRGCIGTTEPTTENVITEIVQNAISAAFKDPRFPAVREKELDEISYSVDVLQPPKPVKGIKDLNPKEYGVIVESNGKRGLLLPDLPGIEDSEEQVRIACEKAGISPEEDICYYRFKVKRYK